VVVPLLLDPEVVPLLEPEVVPLLDALVPAPPVEEEAPPVEPLDPPVVVVPWPGTSTVRVPLQPAKPPTPTRNARTAPARPRVLWFTEERGPRPVRTLQMISVRLTRLSSRDQVDPRAAQRLLRHDDVRTTTGTWRWRTCEKPPLETPRWRLQVLPPPNELLRWECGTYDRLMERADEAYMASWNTPMMRRLMADADV
jgi:hypothetical protein